MKQDEQATWHKHKAFSPNTAGPIKSRKIRWVEHEIRLAKASNAQRVLMGKPEGTRRLRRTRRRRNDNISIDLKEIWWEVTYCIKMAQNGGRQRVFVTFDFHIKLGMSLLSEEISAFQEGLCCMELVSQLLSKPFSQLVSQLLSKSVSQLLSKLFIQLFSQSVTQ